jgi:hypothetical protein
MALVWLQGLTEKKTPLIDRGAHTCAVLRASTCCPIRNSGPAKACTMQPAPARARARAPPGSAALGLPTAGADAIARSRARGRTAAMSAATSRALRVLDASRSRPINRAWSVAAVELAAEGDVVRSHSAGAPRRPMSTISRWAHRPVGVCDQSHHGLGKPHEALVVGDRRKVCAVQARARAPRRADAGPQMPYHRTLHKRGHSE